MSNILLSCSYSENISGRDSHYHDFHRILYIIEGSAKITINDRIYYAKNGSLVLFSRLEQHAVEVTSSTYKRYILQIAPNFGARKDTEAMLLSVLLNRPKAFRHVADMSAADKELCPLLHAILLESTGIAPLKETMQDLRFLELLILLYRQYPRLFVQDKNSRLMLVQQIQQRFADSCQKKYTLSDLADEFHTSASHLSHLFKNVTGSSVMDYLKSCRIASAKKYLAETDLTVSEVVEACGFSDFSNFSRTFRQVTGLSPSEFRRLCRAAE